MGYSDSVTLLVDVLDKDKQETGRAVPVVVDYTVETGWRVSGQADGVDRGAASMEVRIVNVWTDALLLAEEEEQVCHDARELFLARLQNGILDLSERRGDADYRRTAFH